MASQETLSKLRQRIRDNQVVVVVGSGVSIAATGKAPAASWKGLIGLGIDACRKWDPRLDAKWAARKRDALDSGDRREFLSVANEIGERIGTTPGRMGEWLRDTVGALSATQPDILDALHALGCPLVTTNYDGLLVREGLRPVTWMDAGKVDRIVRGQDRGIVHLHGHWEDPKTVVLKLEEYVKVRDDPHAAAVRQALSMTSTLLFVGCGDGLSDPNFSVLRRWMATVNPSRTDPHYRLCTDAEHQALVAEHDPEERIDLVPYGGHGDLVATLRSLAPSRGASSTKPGARGGSKKTSASRGAGVAEATARTTVIEAYLAELGRQVARLSLVGFGAALRIDLPIEDAYVPLRLFSIASLLRNPSERVDAQAMEDARLAQENVPVAEVFERAQRMGEHGVVILGDPGSGKTTAARQLCHALLSGKGASVVPGLPEGCVPVLLRLRDLAPGQAKDPWTFVDAHLRECIQDTPEGKAGSDPGPELRERGGVLWIFDGLDEVVDEATRVRVARWLASMVGRRPQDRCLVTSRYAGYQGDVHLGPRFCEFRVHALDDDQVEAFVTRWHQVVLNRLHGAGAKADKAASESVQSILRIFAETEYRIGRLGQLRTNPLLLTILCLVHHEQRSLPGRRADLYQRCVQVLVEEWRKDLVQRSLVPVFDGQAAVDVLGSLAWWLHSEDQRTSDTLDTLGERAAPMLATLSPTAGLGRNGKDFVVRMRDFSGILAPLGPGKCGFMHLTFQEYLAAYHATREGLAGDLAGRLGVPWWREATLLAVAIGSREFAAQFFAKVAANPKAVATHEDTVRQALDEARHPVVDAFVGAVRKSRRAAETLALLRVLRGRSSPDLLGAYRKLATSKDADVARLAGELLQAAGEEVPRAERPRVGFVVRGMLVTREEKTGLSLALIPAGEFLMGSCNGVPDERPEHPVRVSAFRMGRYPVTNAEYGRFLAAHPGTPEPAYWSDSQFNDPRQPVVGIDWEEAMAFCRWIGGRLPTEAEWEYACRAGTTTEYAFGTNLTHEKANFGLKVGATSAVDRYPANSWGLHDMHGNVWEWCADWYDEAYYARSPVQDPTGPEKGGGRVLRGGSWRDPAVDCRSACRIVGLPGLRLRVIGFRVVLAPRSVH